MATRSLNEVRLIGNLTRDPELRYTPSGTAVCTFSVATNRQWITEGGERKEDVEFHRIVAWQKLAEICGKFLGKGRKVYVAGRLQTRSWTGQDGQQRQTTEIVIDDMIILDSRRDGESQKPALTGDNTKQAEKAEDKSTAAAVKTKKAAATAEEKSTDAATKNTEAQPMSEDVAPDDIPF
ncbi:single-stranded DNA-binding protein [Candidatus Roizmanbacteria bacterium]|nr:single-stranded DNA-binding protein [Candidatus Roizmanbacteria bacterium]